MKIPAFPFLSEVLIVVLTMIPGIYVSLSRETDTDRTPPISAEDKRRSEMSNIHNLFNLKFDDADIQAEWESKQSENE